MYNLTVAREFLKQIYVAERLQPPTSVSSVTNAYSTIWSRLVSPSYWRSLDSGEWAKIGVYAVEAYGLFKVSCIRTQRSFYVSVPFVARVFHSQWYWHALNIDRRDCRPEKLCRIQRTVMAGPSCPLLPATKYTRLFSDSVLLGNRFFVVTSSMALQCKYFASRRTLTRRRSTSGLSWSTPKISSD